MNYGIFTKPSRYIGNEVNIVRKDGEVKVALCFPDTYEIGMSHIGLKILYSIINNIPHASAERVYAPWTDLEAWLRKNNIPLASIDNQRPLMDFDVIGFTLQYELSYTNVLNILDLGGIPIKSEERGDRHPLVIAGGPCTVNPLPMVPFIDAFVIGDGEDVIKEIIEVYSRVKGQVSGVNDKQSLLQAISRLEGVYVPSVHDAGKQKISRRIVDDLDKAPFPDAPLLPYTSIVHDRVAIEISRGCTRGCRFCQAGMIYRPLRERSLETVLSLAEKSILNTGYEEVSFTSLSTGDYSSLLPLIRGFNRFCSGSRTSVSLPSLRVGAVNSEVLKEIKSVRKTGFTIAPEAGTKRLRDVINKDFTDEEYDETLKKLFEEGWTTIKLYFMIGLPTETMADIDGLIDMAVKALKKGREITGRRVNVNVGISAFVPKAHTPFQWAGQNSSGELRNKQDYIKRAFKKRGINFKGQHVENSILEAVFARGGKETAILLEKAWRLGCRFDGWTEFFRFETWEIAAQQTGTDLYSYAMRSFGPEQELPWDFIDTGITKQFLKSEYGKASQELITPDCSKTCHGCGLTCKDRAQNPELRTQNIECGPRNIKPETRNSHISTPTKYRVRFSKTGVLRHLGHQELMTSILRALRRASIAVSYSAGFHPLPRISFGPALAAGIEGLNEYFDIETPVFINSDDFLTRLNSALPEGLKADNADSIPVNARSLNESISVYEYEIIIDKSDIDHINSFMSSRNWPVSREKKTVDIRPMVEKAELLDNRLLVTLADTEDAKVRLFEILKEMFQKTVDELQAAGIKRTGLYGYNKVRKVCL
ncbi:MAG: TIGR03960 family B12-binding radical SAM protein [Nitrospirae bacterium]|nr:TIGR03960 family B12-binding radical SAM protein [Nitrospirota bacterium]